MGGFEKLCKLIGQNMGVNLRRRDISMAEQCLDAAEVCTALQQVGRVGMAQGVGSRAAG